MKTMLSVCGVPVNVKVAIKMAACTAARSFPLKSKINNILSAGLHVVLRCTKHCFLHWKPSSFQKKPRPEQPIYDFTSPSHPESLNRNDQLIPVYLILTV